MSFVGSSGQESHVLRMPSPSVSTVLGPLVPGGTRTQELAASHKLNSSTSGRLKLFGGLAPAEASNAGARTRTATRAVMPAPRRRVVGTRGVANPRMSLIVMSLFLSLRVYCTWGVVSDGCIAVAPGS